MVGYLVATVDNSGSLLLMDRRGMWEATASINANHTCHMSHITA